MRKWNVFGYETCVHSMKRKQASWRVHDTCPNPAHLFAEYHYALPYKSVCMTCRYYCRDKCISERSVANGNQ